MFMIFHHVKKFLLENENQFLGVILSIFCLVNIGILWNSRVKIQLVFSQNIVYLPTQIILNNLIYIVYLTIASSILLIANEPRRKYSRTRPKFISLLATFLPYTLIFFPVPASLRVPIFIPLLLVFLGVTISTIALLSLRQSFSITPEVRGFVVSGLYSLVRHPMYLGSFISVAGFVLLKLSIFSVIFYVIWFIIQCRRARFEEQLLIEEYPDYEIYLKKTSGFLPIPKMRRSRVNILLSIFFVSLIAIYVIFFLKRELIMKVGLVLQSFLSVTLLVALAVIICGVISFFCGIFSKIVENSQTRSTTVKVIQRAWFFGVPFAIIGLGTGYITGLSQNPAVYALIPLALSIIGALGIYRFRPSKRAARIATYTLLNFSILLLVGIIIGAGERGANNFNIW